MERVRKRATKGETSKSKTGKGEMEVVRERATRGETYRPVSPGTAGRLGRSHLTKNSEKSAKI